MTPVEWALLGAFGVQTLSAVSSSLPKPKTEGWASFFYLFLQAMTVNLNSFFERKYHVAALPAAPLDTQAQVATATTVVVTK